MDSVCLTSCIQSSVQDPVKPDVEFPEVDPCARSPCGPGAICTSDDDRYTCKCQPGYFGNPYHLCSPECTVNTDCPPDRACVNHKCVDPCPGSCGINADCRVLSHKPTCYCEPGYTGNPYSRCYVETRKDETAASSFVCYCCTNSHLDNNWTSLL